MNYCVENEANYSALDILKCQLSCTIENSAYVSQRIIRLSSRIVSSRRAFLEQSVANGWTLRLAVNELYDS